MLCRRSKRDSMTSVGILGLRRAHRGQHRLTGSSVCCTVARTKAAKGSLTGSSCLAGLLRTDSAATIAVAAGAAYYVGSLIGLELRLPPATPSVLCRQTQSSSSSCFSCHLLHGGACCWGRQRYTLRFSFLSGLQRQRGALSGWSDPIPRRRPYEVPVPRWRRSSPALIAVRRVEHSRGQDFSTCLK